ncbi:hypothetical protein SLEP1_g43304 [Rubroshorea leprosula]|uniref:Uncharacterized protein n=1 Tax=Rubroshorea leprosula TaxID=152421 RepID=A0AAV5LCJ9_9ROSI|nr:hypothetical protein SLEP1_g43304 [Rubroshorea leprosula]
MASYCLSCLHSTHGSSLTFNLGHPSSSATLPLILKLSNANLQVSISCSF